MHFAYLFMENSSFGLLDKMKFEFKMPHDFSRKVVFLLDLINLTSEKAIELYKKRAIIDVSDEELLLWYELAMLNKKEHKAFINYKPTANAEELMQNGFIGKALGNEITRINLETFNRIKNEI